MAWPEVGVGWGGQAYVVAEANHRRQEQVARPALVWPGGARRTEVEEALRLLDGDRTVTGARIIHILTKVDKASVPVNLVGPQVSLPPRLVPASRGYSFFCA